MATDDQILTASAKHPQPGRIFEYGTAGFRMNSDLLDSVVFRVGLLASLRSRKFNGQTIGAMITASHNPPRDNGVKLVDPMGDMLETSWEAYATELANAPSSEAMLSVYKRLIVDLKIKPEAPSNVVFARDTRASGPALVTSLVDALNATGTKYTDHGYFTTPQLHYVVRCLNTQDAPQPYGVPTEKGYYDKLIEAFKRAMPAPKTGQTKVSRSVTVDCANGVGAPKLKALLKLLPTAEEGGIDVKVVNDDISRPEMLNVQCGADYVKTQQRPPPSSKASPNERCASFDGDADRLMYYFMDGNSKFCLLDGDRMATLAANFLSEQVRLAGLTTELTQGIGIVQTAYANGASKEYIEKTLKVPVEVTATGVKHLHSKAHMFDIGVYFEANGHGTVLFSASAQRVIHGHTPANPAQAAALATLAALNDLINQTVGDAIADLLLVEVILAQKGMSPQTWLGTYTDLPNKLLAVDVRDRGAFRTTDAERKLEAPRGLQVQIDEVVARYSQGRSFARASGTEDKVRVYAEASTRGEAEELAKRVADLVKGASPPE